MGQEVRMTFRVVLARQHAEALAARAIREEKNIGMVVTEILEAALSGQRGGPDSWSSNVAVRRDSPAR